MRSLPLIIDRPLRAFGADRRGATAVEFALLSPVLMLLAAGVIDVSRLIAETMQVASAAQAAADWAQRNGWNQSAIQSAAASATAVQNVTVTVPAPATGCISNGVIVAQAAGNCATGGGVAQFVTVKVQAPFIPLVPWPGLKAVTTVNGQAMVRLS